MKRKTKDKIGDWVFGIFMLVLVCGSQYLIYCVLSPSVYQVFPVNGKYILILIIAFCFIFLASAVGYGIMNSGKTKENTLE